MQGGRAAWCQPWLGLHAHLGPLAGYSISPEPLPIQGPAVSGTQCLYAPGYTPRGNAFEDFKDSPQVSSTDRRKQ